MPEPPLAAPDLLQRVALFGRLLRDAGVETGPGRVADAARALTHVSLGRRADVAAALRATLCSRREDLAVFGAAFDVFWGPLGRGATRPRPSERGRPLLLDPRHADAWRTLLGVPAAPPRPPELEPDRGSGYSPEELLRRRDFGEMTWEEAQQARRLLEQSSWRMALRRTRRLEPAHHGLIDLRRSARRSIRSGGEILRLDRRRQRWRRRPIVLLCDTSGSMERYSRMLVLFAMALTRREDVETFLFATRLTRVTRLLQQRDADVVLDRVSRTVPDFSGGTRIGEAIREFNLRWARRLLGHGAVVVVISDGWDRGDARLLGAEVRRLRRSAHRLVWLNPLAGSERYAPAAAGMAAALPYCDDFLAANNLAALDDLGRLLAELGPRPRATATRTGDKERRNTP